MLKPTKLKKTKTSQGLNFTEKTFKTRKFAMSYKLRVYVNDLVYKTARKIKYKEKRNVNIKNSCRL